MRILSLYEKRDPFFFWKNELFLVFLEENCFVGTGHRSRPLPLLVGVAIQSGIDNGFSLHLKGIGCVYRSSPSFDSLE